MPPAVIHQSVRLWHGGGTILNAMCEIGRYSPGSG